MTTPNVDIMRAHLATLVAVHAAAGIRGMTTSTTDAQAGVTAYAMTVLVPDVEEAQRLAGALDDVRCPDGPLAVIAVPPVRGLAFFADTERQAKLDRWWAHAIPAGSVPIHLLLHEEGVPDWLPGLDGRFVVGISAPGDAARYAGMESVTVAGGDTLLDLALAAVAQFAAAVIFREDAADRLERRLRRPAADTASRFRRARIRPADEVFKAGTLVAGEHHPIPNVPPAETGLVLGEEMRREDLVRALAETLRRLQRIRSAT